MAFHLHLINAGHDQARELRLRLCQSVDLFAPAETHLALHWDLGDDGVPRARWILAL